MQKTMSLKLQKKKWRRQETEKKLKKITDEKIQTSKRCPNEWKRIQQTKREEGDAEEKKEEKQAENWLDERKRKNKRKNTRTTPHN